MERKPLILVTEPIAETGLQILGSSCELRTPWAEGRTFDDSDLREASAIIVRLVPVTASLIHKGANLRVIGRHGVGLDTVDLAAATSRRIPVVYTPFTNSNAVAEHAMHLILGLARHVVAGDRAVREIRFDRRNSLVGFELRRKVLGVVGLGSVGLRAAQIGHKGFEMEVLGYDPFAKLPSSHDFVKQLPSLRELLERADIVTLHLPLTPATHHLINAESLAWMKPSALLINTARGAILDTSALAKALENGQLAGAGLDVLEDEPPTHGHPLLHSQKVLFSPHVAGSTREAQEAMAESVARQVLQVLRGELPEFPANPEVFEKVD